MARIFRPDRSSCAVLSVGAHVFILHIGPDGGVTRDPISLLGPADPIRQVCAVAADTSAAPSLVVVAREDKSMTLVDADSGLDVATHKTAKRATVLMLTKLALPGTAGATRTLLAADRTGEVVAWECEEPRRSRVLLGHTATVITDLAVSPSGHALFSADRDEKVRISSLPFGRPVLNYCLGHTRYVRRLAVLREPASALLLSGGGDGTLRLWDWASATCVGVLDISPHVPPAPVAAAPPPAPSAPVPATAAAGAGDEEGAEGAEGAGAGVGGAASEPEQPCVFDLVESPLVSGRFAALVAAQPLVLLIDVVMGDGAAAPELRVAHVLPLPSHPMFATYDADGTLVCGCADGVLRAVGVPSSAADAAAPASPDWLRAANALLAPVVPGVGAAAGSVPMAAQGGDIAFQRHPWMRQEE